jgi:hypothetical protein
VQAWHINKMTPLALIVRNLGPYAALLLLPGGSVVALCLWALRHRAWFVTRARRARATLAALAPHHSASR